ncbi:hypothetical protein PENVUL_c002G02729 [Penicillium vulpinum]|uniref:Dynein light chain n=1 Tax=Penicillium vulpinum TaxID=29845 RepID=A0A1V6SC37_9EURO|nr:hypothetical protein PENVUL_c002G02729 [Penicillium vulpinum]
MGGLTCVSAIKLPARAGRFKLSRDYTTTYPISFLSHHRIPFEVFLIQQLLIMALPPAEKKEPMEAQIKSVDMTEDMQQEAIALAIEATEKFRVEKDIAQYIKKEFDSRKGATWHCVVGRNFGSFVTHETKHFIYFYLGHCAILLFKTQ